MPLPPHIRALIATAWEDGYPLLLAVNGEQGPVMGPKGSMIAFYGEHLAYLERTRGAILDCLRRDPRVCIMYVNMKAQRGGYQREAARITGSFPHQPSRVQAAAGIQSQLAPSLQPWVPAFAGTSGVCGLAGCHPGVMAKTSPALTR